ncbi:MAG: hypothetical protein ACI8T1_001375 [Verrucomicrobiales bacterium]
MEFDLGSGSFLSFFFLSAFLSESVDFILASFFAESLDGCFFGQSIGGSDHHDFLSVRLFTDIEFDFFEAIELFKRRTDACFTAASSNSSHADHIRGGRLFFSNTDRKAECQRQQHQ